MNTTARPGRIQVYRRKLTRKWAWRLIAANGNKIATDGGQGYNNRQDAVNMATAIVGGMYAGAAVEVEG